MTSVTLNLSIGITTTYIFVWPREAAEQKYDCGGGGGLACEATKQPIIRAKCPRAMVKNGGGGAKAPLAPLPSPPPPSPSSALLIGHLDTNWNYYRHIMDI